MPWLSMVKGNKISVWDEWLSPGFLQQYFLRILRQLISDFLQGCHYKAVHRSVCVQEPRLFVHEYLMNMDVLQMVLKSFP